MSDDIKQRVEKFAEDESTMAQMRLAYIAGVRMGVEMAENNEMTEKYSIEDLVEHGFDNFSEPMKQRKAYEDLLDR